MSELFYNPTRMMFGNVPKILANSLRRRSSLRGCLKLKAGAGRWGRCAGVMTTVWIARASGRDARELMESACSFSHFFVLVDLTIFQRFRQIKFIEKFKTRVKNLKIEKIVAFDKYLHELFFAFYFHLSKNLFLTLKNNEVADLTHFSTKCGCFWSF